jgi:hypothetical protein
MTTVQHSSLFDDISSCTTGLTMSQTDSFSTTPKPSKLLRQKGKDLLQFFFPDERSFLFLIFEEIDNTEIKTVLRKDSDNQVLHPESLQHLKGYHVMAIHPEGNQYLVRDAHRHVHYGVWRPQLLFILELLQLSGKIDKVVPYEGTKCHDTTFAIVRNGREATTADPGFQSFDFGCVEMATCHLEKGSRANVAESYGYATLSYENQPDKASGCFRPSIKKNTIGNTQISSVFLSMSDSIRYMDPRGVFYNPLHPLVADRRDKFSVRLGTEAGLDLAQSQSIIGEGLTLFCNRVPSHLVLEGNDNRDSGLKDPWEPMTLRHLELEIANFLPEMPIKPHADRKNCPQENFNILACTSKFFKLPDGNIVRMGGLLYFREVCSHFVTRGEIGDVIEHHLRRKITELPIELQEVLPYVPLLLESKKGVGIFAHPVHLNKCMYFSILVDRINLLSRVHKMTLPRRVELCSIALALNGMDLPWVILTGWEEMLPRKNLFAAFVEDATKMNNGTVCSKSSFRRSVPSNNHPMALPEVLYMNQVTTLCFHFNSMYLVLS